MSRWERRLHLTVGERVLGTIAVAVLAVLALFGVWALFCAAFVALGH